MFQARHLREIAETLRKFKARHEDHVDRKAAAMSLTLDMADMLEETSPRFQRNRFLDAAGSPELKRVAEDA